MNSTVDPSTVLDALIRACSQDALVLKPAEQQLMWWENQPGFYSILAVSVFVLRQSMCALLDAGRLIIAV